MSALTPSFGKSIRGSDTYRAEVTGRVGVVAAGRHFAAEAGLRMLVNGGNAVDAGVSAVFAAAVSEISHFGLGGEVPILIHLADREEVVVINGQGPAPAAASADALRAAGGLPTNGPSAGCVPAVVDSLVRALWEFGTCSLGETLAPAIALAEKGFPWDEFLTFNFEHELQSLPRYPSGARVYLQGPGGTLPQPGSVFRQPELARTLQTLVAAENAAQAKGHGRAEALRAARDAFYHGDIATRIAASVAQAGGLLTAADLAGFEGRIEAPTRLRFDTPHGRHEICKTGFWGQGPVLLQSLHLLGGFDLRAMGHNSAEYVHTVTEALKLSLADRDTYYGDPDHTAVPAGGLLADEYATARRTLIDSERASMVQRPGQPWDYEPGAAVSRTARRPTPGDVDGHGATSESVAAKESPDTTCVNAVDEQGNLFSAAPSSAWVFGGVFIAGDTGVPLGNRMQAFVLEEDHPNVLAPGKRPRTTLSPSIVLRDGKPFLCLSSPGGDTQDQQALQVLLNIMVFGMTPQAAVEAPRFDTLHHQRTFGRHEAYLGVLQVEDRIDPSVIDALRRLGHQVRVVGPFMMDSGTTVVGVDPRHDTLFGAADVRRQRAVVGW